MTTCLQRLAYPKRLGNGNLQFQAKNDVHDAISESRTLYPSDDSQHIQKQLQANLMFRRQHKAWWYLLPKRLLHGALKTQNHLLHINTAVKCKHTQTGSVSATHSLLHSLSSLQVVIPHTTADQLEPQWRLLFVVQSRRRRRQSALRCSLSITAAIILLLVV